MSSSKIASTVSSTDSCPCFKLVVVGDASTGKTAFLNSHRTGEFHPVYEPTIGSKVIELKFTTNQGKVQFSCWDVAGQEPNAGLENCYYVNADCAIIMYDVTDGRTYENVSTWLKDLRRICKNIPIVLCGNKVDMDNKKVDLKMIRFREKKFHYQEISVKRNDNLKKPFLCLIRDLLRDPSLHFVENNTLDEAQTYREVETRNTNMHLSEHNTLVPPVAQIKPALQMRPPNLHFAKNAAPSAPDACIYGADRMLDPIPHFVVNNTLPVPEVEMQDASILFPENTALASPVAHIDPAVQMWPPNLHFAENAALAAPEARIYRADRRLHESLVAAAASAGEPLNNGVVDDGCTSIEFTCCCRCRFSFKQNRRAP